MDFDIDFIKNLKKQDKQSHTEFYLKTVDIFFRYLKSYYNLSKQETEDIVSSFYMRFRNVVKQYKGKSFESFVRTIFRNILKDYFKKHKEKYFTEKSNKKIEFEDSLESEEISINDFLNQQFQEKNINQAIDELDDLSKEIIYLKFVENKKTTEIAKIYNTNILNIRKKLSRIMQKLKRRLQQYE